MNNFKTYLSPFSWRYGSDAMRQIWSEENKYKVWREIWTALAKAQYKAGLLTKEELEDIEKQKENIDIEQILENEKETKHDVVAAIKEFSKKAKVGGGKIHLGATSMDIVDNADALRIKQSFEIIERKIKKLLLIFSEKIEKYADHVCIGYTHLQPAEPTTTGYRLSFYAQDLLTDYNFLQFVKIQVKAKGMKGAVGTSASYQAVLKEKKLDPTEMEKEVMEELGIDASLIASQVYTRKYDYLALAVLASISSSLGKFAGDLRILQSPSIGEWSEPFGKKQVGSSAMPFKRNPINAEKISSLARYISVLPQVVLENATLSYLERTLDDSANKRILIPEAFLAVDEILDVAIRLVEGLVINEKKVAYNLEQFAPFAGTETILIRCVEKEANRQAMHEILRDISMKAWADIQEGKPNPMIKLLVENKEIKKYLKEKEIKELLDVTHHVGNAPKRALELVKIIKKIR